MIPVPKQQIRQRRCFITNRQTTRSVAKKAEYRYVLNISSCGVCSHRSVELPDRVCDSSESLRDLIRPLSGHESKKINRQRSIPKRTRPEDNDALDSLFFKILNGSVD